MLSQRGQINQGTVMCTTLNLILEHGHSFGHPVGAKHLACVEQLTRKLIILLQSRLGGSVVTDFEAGFLILLL